MSERFENIKNSIEDYKMGRYITHEIEEIDIASLRKALHMDQDEFSQTYRIPLKTLRNWEQSRREPSGATLAYLKVISERPDMVKEVLNGHA